jgi:hypothetical protein
MTYPGFQANLAAQRASDAALRSNFQARGDALRAAQQGNDAALRAGRGYRPAVRRQSSPSSADAAGGSVVLRAIGRFIRFVITLAIIVAGLIILALVLKQAEPALYQHAVSWIRDRL